MLTFPSSWNPTIYLERRYVCWIHTHSYETSNALVARYYELTQCYSINERKKSRMEATTHKESIFFFLYTFSIFRNQCLTTEHPQWISYKNSSYQKLTRVYMMVQICYRQFWKIFKNIFVNDVHTSHFLWVNLFSHHSIEKTFHPFMVSGPVALLPFCEKRTIRLWYKIRLYSDNLVNNLYQKLGKNTPQYENIENKQYMENLKNKIISSH